MRVSLLFVYISLLSLTACATPPESKMTIKVLDEESQLPMTNCLVKTRYLIQSNWNESDKYNEMEAVPNADGLCTFAGLDCIPDFGGGVVAEGYYRASFSLPSTGFNRVLNRWEPWNPTIEVRMRQIKNPVPMIYRQVNIKKIPEMNKPVGFDLEKSDWVAPYGKGVISDFIFNASWFFQDPQRGSDARYTLSFSNEYDGFQTYLFPKEISSSFKWPYEAPLIGYQSVLKKYILWPVNGAERQTDYNETNNYIFRVRAKQLEDGTIIGCYGMIQRDIEVGPKGSLIFGYWFNPVPNERSLEYNDVNLLPKVPPKYPPIR